MKKEELKPAVASSVFIFCLAAIATIIGLIGIGLRETPALAAGRIYTYTGISAQIMGISYILFSAFVMFSTGRYRVLPVIGKVTHENRKKIVIGLCLVFILSLVVAVTLETNS